LRVAIDENLPYNNILALDRKSKVFINIKEGAENVNLLQPIRL